MSYDIVAYLRKEDQAAAAKRHYERNKPLIKARAIAYTKKHLATVRQYIVNYLESHPCISCGESDTVVLEFSHRDASEKRFYIGEAPKRGFSLDSVVREIAKCDILCANCNRRRVYKAQNRKSRESTLNLILN